MSQIVSVCTDFQDNDLMDLLYIFSPGYYNNSDSGGECGVPHEKRFPMPRPALDYPWSENPEYLLHYGILECVHSADHVL